MAKLGEVCLLKAGKFVSANDISPEYNKGLYPCFGGNGIRGYVADYTHDGEFPLIGRQGALCGNVNLASGKFHATEHAVVVQPKIEMNVHWLYYALNAMNLGQYATGAAQPGLAVSKLETLSIEIPNISEQNKIAQTLYKVEQLVNFRKQQLAKLDELVKARFVEMFGEPAANPNRYKKKKLSEIAVYFNGLTYKPENVSDEGMIVLRSSNIQNGKLDFEDVVRVDCAVKEKFVVKENDILMCSRNGSSRLVGKVALIKNVWEPMSFGAFMMIIRSDYYWYLMTYFQMASFREQIKAGTTTTINQITGRMLDSIMIPLPPVDVQNQFATFAERVDKQKQTVQQSLEKLELMKKALMQEYFG